MASRNPLLGVVATAPDLGASSSVASEPGLCGLLSGTRPLFLGLLFCRSCSSDLTLGLPPEGRDGKRCLPGGEAGRAGCTGSSGGSKKGGVSMSAGRLTAKEKSLPAMGGGVDEKDGLKVAASRGLKRAEDCVPELLA